MKDTTVRGGIVYDTSLICGDPNGVCIRNYIPIRKATMTDYYYAELDERGQTDNEISSPHVGRAYQDRPR